MHTDTYANTHTHTRTTFKATVACSRSDIRPCARAASRLGGIAQASHSQPIRTHPGPLCQQMLQLPDAVKKKKKNTAGSVWGRLLLFGHVVEKLNLGSGVRRSDWRLHSRISPLLAAQSLCAEMPWMIEIETTAAKSRNHLSLGCAGGSSARLELVDEENNSGALTIYRGKIDCGGVSGSGKNETICMQISAPQ